ncbi:bestrophin family protein [Burkholderia cepacia]|uniref:Multidrug transporter n=1 Tax=Burkholderia cepacia TaxID=292 RepID=A0A8I1DLJ9_BURCE|nr:bestrophin family ion channel [Burkholderia cepacia]MBA9897743.1 multidrug transporter [Burkholderia cepacia]MBA9944511.1 multidrug transporter [Burkholderia cepacia]MBA9974900.1 multidrug transporter [Burkholderia cepacia]MBA9992949.1 multidrug transporter [Burkholderia cepacia]MBB0001026.1 multidrug transporter [Burkholderia cepacia]
MHLGRSYKLSEFLIWTRWKIYELLIFGSVPVVLYKFFSITWLSIPLTIVVLLGTATSFIVGFKNVQTYNRAADALEIWTDILSKSRRWGQIARDFVADEEVARKLVYRHLAWLTALRYDLRRPRIWESTTRRYNAEYRRFYRVPEWEKDIGELLPQYLSPAETAQALSSSSITTCVLSLQGTSLKTLYQAGQLNSSFYMELQKTIGDFVDLQSRSERFKNFPYPRQYATVSSLFVRFFCLSLPFGLLNEFNRLNDSVSGFMHGNMVWLVVPCSVAVSWMYTSLEQVGESTENPFEGGANDVPISTLCSTIERDLKAMLGEQESEASSRTIIAL